MHPLILLLSNLPHLGRLFDSVNYIARNLSCSVFRTSRLYCPDSYRDSDYYKLTPRFHGIKSSCPRRTECGSASPLATFIT